MCGWPPGSLADALSTPSLSRATNCVSRTRGATSGAKLSLQSWDSNPELPVSETGVLPITPLCYVSGYHPQVHEASNPAGNGLEPRPPPWLLDLGRNFFRGCGGRVTSIVNCHQIGTSSVCDSPRLVATRHGTQPRGASPHPYILQRFSAAAGMHRICRYPVAAIQCSIAATWGRGVNTHLQQLAMCLPPVTPCGAALRPSAKPSSLHGYMCNGYTVDHSRAGSGQWWSYRVLDLTHYRR